MLEPTMAEPGPPSLLAGKYRLDREVGRGGMGVVYLATHIALEQRFAIKIVLPALASNPAVSQRLLREARCAAQITGDHVVRVLDVGQLESGQPFIVMEYVEGKDLARVLAERGPLQIQLAVHWLLEACVAIAEAHRKGIIHRDLKPGNLFLSRAADGRELIKVIDFGISKQLGVSGERPVTHANEVVGSPNYMSPEQIRTPLLVDPRADIWALGAILLELLTGQRAFPGESITAVYTRVLEGEPDLHETAGAELPADLRAVVLRCLHKDPNHRFQTVNELATALAPHAPARSAPALEAIAHRLDGTRAESAPTRSRSHEGRASASGLAGGFAGSASGPRARSLIVPGVLLGVVLSAACATLIAGPERLLARLAGLGAPAVALPATPSSPAVAPMRPPSEVAATPARSPASHAALPSDAPIKDEVAVLSTSPAPRVRPIPSEATDDARASAGPREGASRSQPAPAESRAVTPDAAKPSAPSATPTPAAIPPASAHRNPWDVSTFGGRS